MGSFKKRRKKKGGKGMGKRGSLMIEMKSNGYMKDELIFSEMHFWVLNLGFGEVCIFL